MQSSTLNVNPTLFVVPSKKKLDDYRFAMLQLLSLMKLCFIQILIIHDNISSQVVKKRSLVFGQWMNSSSIHDKFCPPIHKKCHPKSYCCDIKCHMTLNVLLSVVYRLDLPWPGLDTHLF